MQKLSAIDFTELYLNLDQPQQMLVRDLQLNPAAPKTPHLTAMPSGFEGDIQDLISLITAGDAAARKRFGITERDMSEFPVFHDGIRYRCTQVDPPIDALETRFFVLRRIRTDLGKRLSDRLAPRVQSFVDNATARRGIVLFSGSFLTGKTRNASLAVDQWAGRSQEVAVTLEDPPEYALDRRSGDRGIIVQVDTSGGHLRQSLLMLRRWSPRFIFFGELRTSDMASHFLHMGISGPLCLATLHAASPTQAVGSLIQFCTENMAEEVAREIIASSLVGIVHHEKLGNQFKTTVHDLTDSESAIVRAKIRGGTISSLDEELRRREILMAR